MSQEPSRALPGAPGADTPADDFDDWLEGLGVKIEPAAAKASTARRPLGRFTDWHEPPPNKFILGGYLARMTRVRCTTCDALHEEAPQVFVEEIVENNPSARRLTLLGRGAQWPAQGTHRLEIIETEANICPACVRDLGFSRESVVEGGGTITLIEGKGLVKK